jgi:hypothetical protein
LSSNASEVNVDNSTVDMPTEIGPKFGAIPDPWALLTMMVAQPTIILIIAAIGT